MEQVSLQEQSTMKKMEQVSLKECSNRAYNLKDTRMFILEAEM
jgi:hypothetical protein